MKIPSVADTVAKPGISNVQGRTIVRERLVAGPASAQTTGPVTGPGAQAVVAAQAPAPTQVAAPADSVTISSDARDAAKLTAMLEEHKLQTEEAEAAFDDFAKCLKIAMRIMNGDHVPLQDIRFLAEREPELLESAMLLRRHNEDPEKHDSVLDEEQDDAAGGNPLLGATAPTAQLVVGAELGAASSDTTDHSYPFSFKTMA